MVSNERRFDLRNRTQAIHERLDAAVGDFSTIEDYRHYLTRLGSFRAAMEALFHDVIWPTGWSWRPTAVFQSLERDAIDLGLSIRRRAGPDIALSNKSALLGALYVLEGSNLGARILRQRAATLGLGDTFGARHLAVMINDIAQWKSFLILLDDNPDFDVEQAAASARAVFAFALQCFEDGTSCEPFAHDNFCHDPSDLVGNL